MFTAYHKNRFALYVRVGNLGKKTATRRDWPIRRLCSKKEESRATRCNRRKCYCELIRMEHEASPFGRVARKLFLFRTLLPFLGVPTGRAVL
jgi:hypothetical protein